MKKAAYLLVSLIIFNACQIKRLDTTKLADEMKATELKRITPEQITAFANQWGAEITNYLNKSKKNEANIDSLSNLFKAKITKIDLLNKNISVSEPKELQLYEAYKYNLEHNHPISENLQKLKGGEIQLYTNATTEKGSLWRIEFSKKEIIKKVSIKEIKNMVTK